MTAFVAQVQEFSGRYPRNRIINIGGTSWRTATADSLGGDFTSSGWVNTDVMRRCFAYLRTKLFAGGGPLIVILDTYPAHRAERVRYTARLSKLTSVFVPRGCRYQLPREIWRKHYHETKVQRLRVQISCRIGLTDRIASPTT
jgi:hypothetical protein